MKTKKMVLASMFAALCCVATMIKIPYPLIKGYLNLGDCIVLVSGWLMPPAYGFLAAGVGSALADLFSGYAIYAPATFLIKGTMAIVTYFCFKVLYSKLGNTPSKIIGGVFAEIIMVFSYFVFEGFMYGFAPSAVSIPANGMQGIVGLVIALVIVRILEKHKRF